MLKFLGVAGSIANLVALILAILVKDWLRAVAWFSAFCWSVSYTLSVWDNE